jgi:hypothetical protein
LHIVSAFQPQHALVSSRCNCYSVSVSHVFFIHTSNSVLVEKATVNIKATSPHKPVDLDNEFKSIDWNHVFGKGNVHQNKSTSSPLPRVHPWPCLHDPHKKQTFTTRKFETAYFFPYEHWLTLEHDSLTKSADSIRKSLCVCILVRYVDSHALSARYHQTSFQVPETGPSQADVFVQEGALHV